MKYILKAGATSVNVPIFIQDSSVATGAGLTGLVFNSASLTAYYHRQGASSATAITLVTATIGTWTSGGFIQVDATNMPGIYLLSLPNAAIASGATFVSVLLKGATNMAPVVFEIQLVAYDPQDTVRLGLTALPNAAAAATGGVPTVDASNAVKVQSGTSANQISLSSGTVTLTDASLTAAKIASDAITAAKIASDTITAAKIASGAITSAKFASGAIDATAIATDAITAAKIATDAIGASELAADAVTEIQSGLATSSSIAALNNLSTAQVNAEVDTALADYDAPTKAEMDSAFAALNDISVADILAGVIEGSITLKGSLRLALSVLTGKSSGGGTTTVTFRDSSDAKDRVIATVTSAGDRTAVTLDVAD